jgi:hypothetical protein
LVIERGLRGPEIDTLNGAAKRSNIPYPNGVVLKEPRV